MKSVHLISLGCPKNLVDSETMLGLLKKSGIDYQAEAPGSDAVIINTCGFLQSSVKESIDTILEAVDLKQQGKTKRVVVTGCLTQRYQGDLQNELPEVDLFLGTGNFHRIAHYLQELESSDAKTQVRMRSNEIPDPDYLYDHTTPRLQATLRHTAYVKVSEGCSRTCAFCIIPKLRGDHRSRTIDSLRQEIQHLVDNGVMEVNLVAQDMTAYGKDLRPKEPLAKLLKNLCSIDNLNWLRLHYAYPVGFDDELIQTIHEQEKICSYIDMPLQHIDDGILTSMRRQTREQSIRNLLDLLRQRIQPLTLRTTMIVGFPGETEAAFQKLYDFVAEQKFHHLGVFTYSLEPGTTAATMPNQIPDKIKEERRDAIMKLQQKIALQNNRQAVGKQFPALVESQLTTLPTECKTKHAYYARLRSQAPDIDGRTIIYTNNDLPIGSIQNVKIDGAAPYDLFASC